MSSDEQPTSPSFQEVLEKFQKKLPQKLGDLDNTKYPDKELCYKFLYCYSNNEINKTNESVKAVYNQIINAYYKKQNTDSIVLDSNITFDVGFIINVNPPVQVITGGSTPTQKRRPNKPKKRNRTIKDRVRVKTR